MPFFGPGGTGDARIQLEQVAPKRFKLLVGFHYKTEAGDGAFEVSPGSLGETDLTSVPFLFRWFVNSYGRHTLPALLHDCLVEGTCASAAGLPAGAATPPTRSEADAIFLEALANKEVPWIRRHLMWAAVTFNTRFTHSGGLATAMMILWLVAAVTGTTLFFGGFWWAFPVLPILGALAPIPFAILWSSGWKAGIWFGYGTVFLLPAAVIVLGSFSVYWLVERLLSTSPPPSPRGF